MMSPVVLTKIKNRETDRVSRIRYQDNANYNFFIIAYSISGNIPQVEFSARLNRSCYEKKTSIQCNAVFLDGSVIPLHLRGWVIAVISSQNVVLTTVHKFLK